ncbi:MAG: hypothetical protein AAF517_14390, partial [Planctomycetota bacterium]
SIRYTHFHISRAISWFSLAAICLSAVDRASAETFFTDQAHRFELSENGLWYWTPSSCDSENGQRGRIVTITDRDRIVGNLKRPVNNCSMIRADKGDVVWRGPYLYYFDGSELSRSSAFFGQSAQTVRNSEGEPAAVAGGGIAPFSLAINDDHDHSVYWAATSRSGRVALYRSSGMGWGPRETVATLSTFAERIVPFVYETSPGVQQEAIACLLTNGDLWLFVIGARFATRIETGVLDVTVLQRKITGVVGGVQDALIYAAKGARQYGNTPPPPGSVVRIDARTREKATIFTCQNNDQAIAVTTDPSHTKRFDEIETGRIYVTVGRVECSGALIRTCSIRSTQVYRHSLPGTGGLSSWSVIRASTAGSHRNLRSDGEWLYFLDDNDGNGRQDSIGRIETDAPPLQFDFVADYLEVVQAIQTIDNEVELIAGREGTWVRGYARYRGNHDAEEVFVTAKLHAFLDGVELEGSPFPMLNSPRLTSSVDLEPRRDDAERTYLFHLPKLSPGRLRVEMTVDPNRAFFETWPSGDVLQNNTIARELPVHSSEDPCVEIISPRLGGLRYTFQYNPRIHQVLRRAESLLPVRSLDVFPRTVDVPDVVNQRFSLIDLDDEDDVAALATMNAYRTAIREISAIRECSDNPDSGCPDNNWVIAVHPNVPTRRWGGLSWGRNVVVVKMSDRLLPDRANAFARPFGGITLAHELGHEYGRAHVNCGGPSNPDPFYPYSACFIDDNIPTFGYGFDPMTRQAIPPEDAGDLMSYADTHWISDYTWDAILEKVRAAGGGGGGGGLAEIDGVETWLLVRGEIDAAAEVGSFGIFRAFAAEDAPIARVLESLDAADDAAAEGSPFSIRFLDADGRVLSSSAIHVSHSPDEPETSGGFLQYVAFEGDASRIDLRVGNTIVASRSVSSSAPRLALEPLSIDGDVVTLHWSASDTDGDALSFNIYASGDDGETWQALGIDYQGFGFALSTEELAATNEARLRVDASDGVLGASSTSERFTIAPHAPSVLIGGLNDGEGLSHGTAVSLGALVVDPDQRNGFSYRWSLQRPDGSTLNSISTEESLSLEALSPGRWDVTLIVTDDSGLEGSADLSFDVLPLLVEPTSAPEFDGQPNDRAYRSAATTPIGSGLSVRAWITRTDEDLYVAVAGISPAARGTTANAQVLFDIDGDGIASSDQGDFGLRVFVDGRFDQLRPQGNSFVATETNPFLDAIVEDGPGSWSCEMRIPASFFDDWSATPKVSIVAVGSSTQRWPQFSSSSSPATWGAMRFSSDDGAVEDSNRAPVAIAGADQIVNATNAVDIALNGSASLDPAVEKLVAVRIKTRRSVE